jgi:hypothetical protein
VSLTLVTLNPT